MDLGLGQGIYTSNTNGTINGVNNGVIHGTANGVYNEVNYIDPNAQAFILAARITNMMQKSAINMLVKLLKSAGIWSKCNAIYPFVGGNQRSHSFNLINTSLYQITWVGGVTHDANGVTGNGTNGYGNTGLNANSVLSNVNTHLSAYTRTANMNGGAFNSEFEPNYTYNAASYMTLRTNNKTGGGNMGFTAGADASGVSSSNTLNGFIVGSKTSNVLKKIYRNGVAANTNVNTDNNSLPNGNLCLFGAPLLANRYSANNLAFASIGSGLNDQETFNLYFAVQTYQTLLNRNV
jgi:hypothetical protein